MPKMLTGALGAKSNRRGIIGRSMCFLCKQTSLDLIGGVSFISKHLPYCAPRFEHGHLSQTNNNRGFGDACKAGWMPQWIQHTCDRVYYRATRHWLIDTFGAKNERWEPSPCIVCVIYNLRFDTIACNAACKGNWVKDDNHPLHLHRLHVYSYRSLYTYKSSLRMPLDELGIHVHVHSWYKLLHGTVAATAAHIALTSYISSKHRGGMNEWLYELWVVY